MRLTVMLGCGFALCACASDPEAVRGSGGGAGGTAAAGGVGSGGDSGLGGRGAGGSGASAGQSSSGGTLGSDAGGTSNPGGSSPGGSGGGDSAGGSGSGAVGGGSDAGGFDGGAPQSPRLAVVADFLNQTLSIVDLAKLKEGAQREDALIGKVDLAKYTPGPLDLAITPDGKTALVAISGGWLGAFT